MKRAYDFDLKGVDVEVVEGVVLLSGNVPDQEDRIEAARIAWSAPRIDQVGNEIMLKGKQGFVRNAKDGLLEKAVRARLVADNEVKARNFNVETHDGIVYLLGVARSQGELERAAKIAAQTRGTAEVISYARITDLPQQSLTDQENYKSVQAPSNTRRELPDFLTTEPPAAEQPDAPIHSAPLDQPIPFKRSAPTQEVTGPTAPPRIDIGERLGKELPTDEELGAYRTGAAGDAISVIESEPYYIDPDTGEEIPVSYVNGVVVPKVIK